MDCWPDAWGAVQTTAYQALSGPGQLGKIPTGVQFRITNPSDTAVRLASSRSTCRHRVHHSALSDSAPLVLAMGMLASLAADARPTHRPLDLPGCAHAAGGERQWRALADRRVARRHAQRLAQLHTQPYVWRRREQREQRLH